MSISHTATPPPSVGYRHKIAKVNELSDQIDQCVQLLAVKLGVTNGTAYLRIIQRQKTHGDSMQWMYSQIDRAMYERLVELKFECDQLMANG